MNIFQIPYSKHEQQYSGADLCEWVGQLPMKFSSQCNFVNIQQYFFFVFPRIRSATGSIEYLTLQNLWKWHHYDHVYDKISSKVMESNFFGRSTNWPAPTTVDSRATYASRNCNKILSKNCIKCKPIFICKKNQA